MKFMKEPHRAYFSLTLKAGRGRLDHIKWIKMSAAEDNDAHKEEKNSTYCQLSTRNLRNYWFHCRSRSWRPEPWAARKYVHRLLLRDSLRKGSKMWRSLQWVKTQECVHIETTQVVPLLYEKSLGWQQNCHLTELPSSNWRKTPKLAASPTSLTIAVGKSR